MPNGRPGPKPGTRAYEDMKRAMMRSGGFVVKPGSQKGFSLLLDARGEPASTNLAALAEYLAKHTRCALKYETTSPASVASGDWPAILKSRGAAAMVVIVSDDRTPTTLVAPDDNWAVMNAKKLERNLLSEEAKEKFLEGRIRSQAARTLALLSGCLTQFRNTPSQVFSVEELDNASRNLPMDQVERLGKYMQSRGQTPTVVTSYRRAVQEGWAAMPTNEFQKAVWKELHELPSKPLKIEFDPKKGK